MVTQSFTTKRTRLILRDYSNKLEINLVHVQTEKNHKTSLNQLAAANNGVERHKNTQLSSNRVQLSLVHTQTTRSSDATYFS